MWLLFAACAPPDDPAPRSDDDDTLVGDDDDDDGVPWKPDDTATEPTVVGEPVLFAHGADAAPNATGWVYAFTDRMPIEATLGGVPVLLRPTGVSGALTFVVPDLAPGEYPLVVTSVFGDRETRAVRVADPLFVDIAAEIGLADVHDPGDQPPDCAESLTGLAFADFDLDGDLDAVLGHYGPTTRVLRNDGSAAAPAFVDTDLAPAGLDAVASLAVADIDADGDPDLWVGRRGDNRIFLNRRLESGEWRFEDATEALGLADPEPGRTPGVVFGDPDADGDLDLYEINHAWCFPTGLSESTSADTFWRNDAGTFVDATATLPDVNFGVTGRFGFSGVFVDRDRDGDQDLLIANDFVGGGGPNLHLDTISVDPLQFASMGGVSGWSMHPDPMFKPLNSMGLDVADLNGDGLPDVVVSNIGPNVLFLSEGDRWVESGAKAGVDRLLLPWGQQSVTWGTLLFDWDNDGDSDLFLAGGPLKGNEIGNLHAAFENLGDGTFADRTLTSGLGIVGHGKASAVVDLDDDGFLDLVVASWAEPLQVFRNTLGDRTTAAWVAFDLVGVDGVHPDAFGAIVEIEDTDGRTQTCFHTPRPSMSAAGDHRCRFGLGAATGLRSARVTGPHGGVTEVAASALGTNRRIRVEVGR